MIRLYFLIELDKLILDYYFLFDGFDLYKSFKFSTSD